MRSGKSEDSTIFAGDVIVAPTSEMKETFNTILKATPFGRASLQLPRRRLPDTHRDA
jgi:hypothetical protein